MPPEGNQCDGSHSAESRVIGEKNEKNFATLRVKTWWRVTMRAGDANELEHNVNDESHRVGIERAIGKSET